MRYSVYENNNGKEYRKTGTLPDNAFDKVLENLFFGNTNNFLEDFFSSDRLIPRVNKEHCSGTFPPSNSYIDPDTKELRIVVACCGVSEDEYCVELDNDTIVVSFDRKNSDKNHIYDYKGLKLVTDEVLNFKFDLRYFDTDTISVNLDKGLLVITMLPRKEMMPIRKTLAGSLKKQKALPSQETESEDK